MKHSEVYGKAAVNLRAPAILFIKNTESARSLERGQGIVWCRGTKFWTKPKQRCGHTYTAYLPQAFTRICNTYLTPKGLCIQDTELLTGALDDGVILFHLVKALSGKEVGRLVQPKTRAHKLDNISVSLNFLASDGIRLIGIGAEGLCHRNFAHRTRCPKQEWETHSGVDVDSGTSVPS